MIEFFPFSNKMETTEDEAMKDVMGLLETEPSESDHREQLADISGEWKLQGVPWGSTYPRTN